MSRFVAFAALAVAALALGPQASAKTAPPDGSYQTNCRNYYVDGDTLYGECQNQSGKWKKTWISGYEYCDGDIVNRNGVMDCNGGRLPAYSGAPASAGNGGMPPGGWIDRCRDAVLDGNVLRASCRDNSGTWRPTWVDVRQCRTGTFEIDDGIFVCVAPPPPPAVEPLKDMLPGGTWTESCRSGAVKQWQMRAECFTGNNQWLVTDLDLRKCKTENVSAPGGRLRCGD
jgi:hypothetical protein